ncbi:hypothetical protein EON66_00935 [archaeon]|nr:MAG: hypothetical protein EON66_00935 [archaeon]
MHALLVMLYFCDATMCLCRPCLSQKLAPASARIAAEQSAHAIGRNALVDADVQLQNAKRTYDSFAAADSDAVRGMCAGFDITTGEKLLAATQLAAAESGTFDVLGSIQRHLFCFAYFPPTLVADRLQYVEEVLHQLICGSASGGDTAAVHRALVEGGTLTSEKRPLPLSFADVNLLVAAKLELDAAMRKHAAVAAPTVGAVAAAAHLPSADHTQALKARIQELEEQAAKFAATVASLTTDLRDAQDRAAAAQAVATLPASSVAAAGTASVLAASQPAPVASGPPRPPHPLAAALTARAPPSVVSEHEVVDSGAAGATPSGPPRPPHPLAAALSARAPRPASASLVSAESGSSSAAPAGLPRPPHPLAAALAGSGGAPRPPHPLAAALVAGPRAPRPAGPGAAPNGSSVPVGPAAGVPARPPHPLAAALSGVRPARPAGPAGAPASVPADGAGIPAPTATGLVPAGAIPAEPPAKPKKPTPEVHGKVKALFWNKVPDFSTDDTIWSSLDDRRVSVNVSDVEALFGVATTASSTPSGTGSPTNSANSNGAARQSRGTAAPVAVSILDPKRSQNAAIALARLRLVPSVIRDALLSGDMDVCTADRLSLLQTISPTGEEVQTVTAYEGDKKMLASFEQYVLAMSEVPRYEARVNALAFLQRFNALFSELYAKCKVIQTGLSGLDQCTALRGVLEHILAIGNVLNNNSARGNAYGVKLDTLKKCSTMKSVNSGVATSLLDYLALVAVRYETDASNPYTHMVDLKQQLASVSAARSESLDVVAQDVNAFVKQFEAAQKLAHELQAMKAGGGSKDTFGTSVMVLTTTLQPQVTLLSSTLRDLQSAFKQTLKFVEFFARTVPSVRMRASCMIAVMCAHAVPLCFLACHAGCCVMTPRTRSPCSACCTTSPWNSSVRWKSSALALPRCRARGVPVPFPHPLAPARQLLQVRCPALCALGGWWCARGPAYLRRFVGCRI